MNWKNPATDLPEDGQTIWVLDQHWKKNGALSCEIFGAVVRHVKTDLDDELIAENADYIGKGWRTLVIRDFQENKIPPSDVVTAWCALEEIPLPSFLIHRRKSTD